MTIDRIVVGSTIGHRFSRLLVYLALILAAVVYIGPLIVVLLTSVKSLDEVRAGTLLQLPHAVTFAPWKAALLSQCIGVSCTGLSHQFVNSFAMVIPAVLLSTPLGAVNGYALTLWTFKGHEWAYAFLLFGVFMPLQIVLIPVAHVLGLLGLADTLPGLVLLHVIYGIPFTTLFFRNFFVTVPRDLVSAARVDGASFWQVFFRIVLPVAIPSFVVSTIWQFTNIWNDFLLASTFTDGQSAPVTVALYDMVGAATGVKEYNVDMAAVMLTALPTLLVYIFAGRYFIRGLMAGSMKG